MFRWVMIFIFLVKTGAFVFGQKSEPLLHSYVDSFSYILYEQQAWQPLAAFGERAAKQGYDYYYFNLRVGIAHYELLDYDRAAIFFERAFRNNSTSQVAIEYLYLTQNALGDLAKADAFYALLDEERRAVLLPIGEAMQPVADKQKAASGKLEWIYLSGGNKNSDYDSLAGDVMYFNIGLHHRLNSKLSFYHAYTYSSQVLVWGNFTQHEYHLQPKFALAKGLTIEAGLHYAHYKSAIKNSWQSAFRTPPPPPLPPFPQPAPPYIDSFNQQAYRAEGGYRENALLTQLTLTKTWKNIEVAPHLALYSQWTNPYYTEIYDYRDDVAAFDQFRRLIDRYQYQMTDTTVYSTAGLNFQVMGGASAYFYNDRFSVGADASYLHTDTLNSLVVVPFARVQLAEKWSVSGYYFRKPMYQTAALFGGSQLYNLSDGLNKYSFTGEFAVSPTANLYLTFQRDSVRTNTDKNYHFNTFLLELKLKL